MKVGPLDLPVSNGMQVIGFALMVLLVIFATRKLTFIPAQFRP